MFSKEFVNQTIKILKSLDHSKVEIIVEELKNIKLVNGRLFFCGIGGSAGHASHAVNDFRKLAGIESYSPTDNVSEVTARTNDEGFETVFEEYLKVSKFNENDAIFILSVGGGSKVPPVSLGLIKAIDFVRDKGGKILGIVGRDGGYTSLKGTEVLTIPNLFPENVTPHTEGIAAIVWHLMVSHPSIKEKPTKW